LIGKQAFIVEERKERRNRRNFFWSGGKCGLVRSYVCLVYSTPSLLAQTQY
jgi:hypothetical protein